MPYLIKRQNDFPRELKYSRSLPMSYTIETIDDVVTVPAGRFERCIRVKGTAEVRLYTDPVAGWRDVPLVTTEWYAPGIGLVKLERIENLQNSPYMSGGKNRLPAQRLRQVMPMRIQPCACRQS